MSSYTRSCRIRRRRIRLDIVLTMHILISTEINLMLRPIGPFSFVLLLPRFLLLLFFLPRIKIKNERKFPRPSHAPFVSNTRLFFQVVFFQQINSTELRSESKSSHDDKQQLDPISISDKKSILPMIHHLSSVRYLCVFVVSGDSTAMKKIFAVMF